MSSNNGAQLSLQGIVHTFDGSRDYANKVIKHAEKLKSLGLCVRCRKPNPSTTRRCPECTQKAVAANKKRIKEISENDRCIACGKAWTGNTRHCRECLEAQRSKWTGRASSDFCSRCASPKTGKHKACPKCREHMRKLAGKRRERFIASGRCIQCGKESLKNTKFCVKCTLRTAARKWLGSASKWELLRSLFDSQKGICVYSGIPIAIGVNASLDHKIPRSKGGQNVIENLQWLDWTINRMKTNLSHDEFIRLCKVIASKHIHRG